MRRQSAQSIEKGEMERLSGHLPSGPQIEPSGDLIVLGSAIGSRDASVTVLALWAISVTAALIVVISFILDLVGILLTPATVAVPALALAAAGIGLRTRSHRPQLPLAEMIGALSLILAVVGWYVVSAPPTLYPTTPHIDAVHHYQLIDFIYSFRRLPRLPEDLAGYLGGMAPYPFGSHLLVAVGGWACGLAPIQIMVPAGAILVCLTVLFAYATMLEARYVGAASVFASVAASLLLFYCYEYLIVQFNYAYFLGHIGGSLWTLSATFWLARYSRTLAAFDLVALSATLLALAASYPSWLPAAAIAIALTIGARSFLTGGWRDGSSRLLAVFGPCSVFLVFFLRDRLQIGLYSLTPEGWSTLPRLSELALAAIAVLGAATMARDWPRHLAVLSVSAAIVTQTMASYLSAAFGITSYYTAHKMWYLVIYYFAILAAAAIGALADPSSRPSKPAGRRAVVMTLVSIVCVAGPLLAAREGQRWPQDLIITPDLYSIAVWTRENIGDRPVTYVTSDLNVAYFVHSGIMRRSKADLLGANPVSPFTKDATEWINRTDLPSTAITTNPDLIARSVVIYQTGTTAVVRRR